MHSCKRWGGFLYVHIIQANHYAVESYISPHLRCWSVSWPSLSTVCTDGMQVLTTYGLPFMIFCEDLWGHSCVNLPLLQVFTRNLMNGASGNLKNKTTEIILSHTPIFIQNWFKIRDPLVWKLWLLSSFFLINFGTISCNFSAPFMDVYDSYTRLAIRFC